MSDKILPYPQFCQDVRWDPFCGWAPQSVLPDQDFGLSRFFEAGEHAWTGGVRRPLAGSSWPGYALPRLFSLPPQAFMQPSLRILKQLSGGLSEVRSRQGKWTISLDVNQFSPEEITIRTREGYLEITGKHEEREDEHGFVSRCFIRKYNLPANLDLGHITSYVSGDGVLSVEIPLCDVAGMDPQKTVIPVQVGENPSSLTLKRKEEEREKAEGVTAETEGSPAEEKRSDPVDPVTAATQASGAHPQLGDPPQQAPGVGPVGSGMDEGDKEAAGIGKSEAGLGKDQTPSQQTAETQPGEGIGQVPAEAQSPGHWKDDEQQGSLQLPEAPPAPHSEQEEQETLIPKDRSTTEESQQAYDEPPTEGAGPTPSQSEYSPQASEEPPTKDGEPASSQSDKHQSSELQIQKEEDTEQAEEHPTKA